MMHRMCKTLLLFLVLLGVASAALDAQDPRPNEVLTRDPHSPVSISTGWANQAVSIGYVTAPATLGLMFVSALVNEWNAGYAGVPASAMILLAPPLIYAGGRSVDLGKGISHPRAKLGWTLYALSIIPTSMALYGFTTEWGATLPLTLASGILGTASIVAMTSYAYSRADTARKMNEEAGTSLQFGISPLSGGALATVVLRF
jgi:hypothetical protein